MRNFEVNIRTMYAMRNCGVEHTGLEKFCGLLNMPQPMTRKNFDVISNKVRDSAEKVAKAKDPKRYESWRIQHEPTCNINYIGSAPNMEVLELLVFLNDHWKIMDFVI